MTKKTEELKQHARSFVAFQAQQPGGIPASKKDLESCYLYYINLHHSSSPLSSSSFSSPDFKSVLKSLKIMRLIKFSVTNDKVLLTRRVIAATKSADKSSLFYCEVCRCNCTDQNNLNTHLSGARHRANVKVQEVKANTEENEKDKNGVSITNPFDVGTLTHGTRQTKLITITNSSDQPHTLVGCELVNKSNSLILSDPSGVTKNDGKVQVIIKRKSTYQVSIECNAFNLGWIRDVIVFKFQGFIITRRITILVDGEGSAELAPISPYVPPPRISEEVPSHIIPGEPLPSSKIEDMKRLPQYKVPPHVHAALNSGEAPNIGVLDFSNYTNFFHYLLWFEEVQMMVDIRRYDMWSKMSSASARVYIALKVPGLAENRPSLLKGDSVYVSYEDKEYEGIVHDVQMETVQLKFDRYFHTKIFDPQTDYKIRFSFKRTPLRRMHLAVDESKPLDSLLLFPNELSHNIVNRILATANNLRPINRRINSKQVYAVAAILNSSARPCPYVIFGPPGTGKTMTIVEAIGQIYKNDKDARILACAPSNTACDLITERLQVIQERDLFRFNAFNRRKDLVPPNVLKVSSYSPTIGTFPIPAPSFLNQKKIIVSTNVNAGYLYALEGVKPFTHIFIDECGQAMEPESLVAISGLITPETVVVLAGDPEQLGPVIRSTHALKQGQGLGKSLLERILQRNPYRWDPIAFAAYGNYDVRYITKLVNNYRSHPEILTLPNELFYHNELVPMADVALRTSLCQWDQLPTKGFPIIFHGIEGKDERESNSPSWFNVSEVQQVFLYINRLKEYRQTRVSNEDIGVITPYRKQAEKIRTLLRGKGMDGVKVGSVEEFQGQEKLIIIISCVRSSNEHIAFDKQHNLGFLSNPKRFNVATTRAQALMIVIGNPHVLVHDQHWQKLIQLCISNNAYVGCNRPTINVDEAMESLMHNMERLQITMVSQVEYQEGPEWRNY